MSCKKYFIPTTQKRNNSKKSILHLSIFSYATVVKCTEVATVVSCPDVQQRYMPRPLKEIAFIKASPTINEIGFEVEEIAYLTNYYKFFCSSKFSIFDVLDKYMMENYPKEYWEIIESFPKNFVVLCCSCNIRVGCIIENNEKVFLNKYYYLCEPFVEENHLWFVSIWRRYENEDFIRMVCNGPDRKLLNDMLLKQLKRFCENTLFSEPRKELLAYDVFFVFLKV